MAHAFEIPYLAKAHCQPLWMWGHGFLLLGIGWATLNRTTSGLPSSFQEQEVGA